MKLTDVETNISNLKMDKEQKEAILKLIDLKTESDMEKAVAKMDGINSEIKRLEDRIDTKFGAMDSKFGAMDTKFAMILWALGILMGLMITLKIIK